MRYDKKRECLVMARRENERTRRTRKLAAAARRINRRRGCKTTH
jgi:hypothetical protein